FEVYILSNKACIYIRHHSCFIVVDPGQEVAYGQ
ncbi:MAG: hypothetical protein ACI9FD_002923, partial [Gammaproteobacteria bacterium]